MSTALTPMQLALAKRAAAQATAASTVEQAGEPRSVRLGGASHPTQEASASDPKQPAQQPAQPAPSKPAVQARPEVLAALAKMRAKQDALEQAPSKPAHAPQQTARINELAARILAQRAKQSPASQLLAETLERQAAARAVQGGEIPWNEEQEEAIRLVTEGKGFVLVGAAGTGKTTCVRQVITDALQRFIEKGGSAEHCTVSCVAFTNRAVKNLVKSCKGIQDVRIRGLALQNCKTIHKTLKFAPVYYDYVSPNGTLERTMRFEPTYTALTPIQTLELVVVDEASMVDLPLWKKLLEATPNAHYIFIGDLNQLKPVFGLSVLGYKLLELPVVELIQVHRQAFDSPILNFQHRYSLKGIPPTDKQLQEITDSSNGRLIFQPLSKMRPAPEQARVLAKAMHKHYLEGTYKPHQDVILLPHGKDGTFGSTLVNQWVAQWMGEERGAVVHEVLCGMGKQYLAVGDYVVHNKEEYFIESISSNRAYAGKQPQEASPELMRSGFYKSKPSAVPSELDDFDAMLELAFEEDGSERKLAASHIVTLVLAQGTDSLDSAMKEATAEDVVSITTKGDLNELSFAYALTVHKSQGSEWRKVFFAATAHHVSQLNRELVYTAMTRAREELHVYYSPSDTASGVSNTIAKAILRPSIAGKNWKEKCRHFADRVEEYQAFMAEPTEYGA